MKLDVRIMAVRSRRDEVLCILNQLGLSEDIVVYDDRGINGGGNAWYNAKRCWTLPFEDYTHRLVIQDDVLLCDDFLKYVKICIEKYPEAIWTFYNGSWIKPQFKKADSPYIKINGCAMSGQATCIPIKYVEDMIQYTDNTLGADFIHDDTRYSFFALTQDIEVMGTIPSLTQHIGFKSYIPHHNNKNRVSSDFLIDASRETWSSDEVSVTPVITNDIWMNKNNRRKSLVEKLKRNAIERIRNDRKKTNI